jgi:hypothetical protein
VIVAFGMFQAAYGDGGIPKWLETSRFAAVILFSIFLSVTVLASSPTQIQSQFTELAILFSKNIKTVASTDTCCHSPLKKGCSLAN